MYEIVRRVEKDYVDAYSFKTKNEQGQPLEFFIYDIEDNQFAKNKKYTIRFHIATKRKHGFQWMKETGKDGLKSLLWAKNCLISFMEEQLKSGDKIIIFADGKQRFEVYKWALGRIGFKESRYQNQSCLLYKKA